MSIKIDDFCTYAPKSEVKAGEASLDGQYMFFTSSEDESKRYNDYQFDGEGIIMGTGGNATLHYYSGKYAVSTDCIVLVPDKRVRCKYLYYFFLANMHVLEAGFKGAGLKHTNKKYIGNIELTSLPALQVQDSVIEILDKVSAVIKARKLELSVLDDLIKSRFVEMFGDIAMHKPLSELCSIITDGTHQPPKFVSEGIPFIFVSNITKNILTYETDRFVNQTTYNELIKRTPIELGDILLSTVGSYGHPAIVRSNKPFLFQRHIAYLKPRRDVLHSDFLYAAILSSSVQKQIEKRIRGVAQKTLNLSEIKKITIPIASMERQMAFSSFLSQINKTKSIVQKSLDNTNLLYNSLMNTYFG